MTVEGLKNLWKKEFAQTAIMIVIILIVVFGLWFGSQLVLGTPYPALAVASGSMCTVQHMYCDGWSHPFGRTLHTGDLIIVRGIRPEEVHAAQYPEGDVIVFHDASNETLIVHRAVEKRIDTAGSIEFKQEGDGNGPGTGQWIPASRVIGKVVLRIPWIGHLALFMRDSSAIYIVVALIILIVIVEFVVPELRRKKLETQPEPAQETERAPET